MSNQPSPSLTTDLPPANRPVYSGYLADPYAWRVGDEYYMIGTGSPEEPIIDGRCFPMLFSRDFKHWEYCGHVLEQPSGEFGDAYWAPEVVEGDDGRFYMYYSVGFDDKRHQIRVAIATSPLGPYTDSGYALTHLDKLPFAIDPHVFRDVDGQRYLFYARDFLDVTETERAGTALVMDRMIDMTRLAGDERVVLRAHHDWQRFLLNRVMYGKSWDWHTLEGPFLWQSEGRYYCFYSGGRWETDEYGVDYGVADKIEGPYVDDSDGPAARITHSVEGRIIGPGHNSVVIGPDGVETYIVYHAWNVERTIRSPYVSKLDWAEGRPLPVAF